MTVDVVTIARSERTRIRDAWCELEASSRPAYFLSWGWVENWLDTLPPSTNVVLHVVRRAGAPIAAFFMGARLRWRHGVIPSRTLHLNQTGDENYDEICIEHNGFLSNGEPIPLPEIVGGLPGRWDEVFLPALDEDGALAKSLLADSALVTVPHRARLRVRVDGRVACPIVELDKVRESGDYLSLLGGSARSQIRKTRKLYAERGPLAHEVASSPAEARAFFDELVELHRRSWAERGKAGAFIPYVLGFHHRLIERRFAAGEIRLHRIRAGDRTVGCLYNFVWQDAALFYQSGLVYEADAKLKPGYLCHALAIEHDARAGLRYYDFLGGDSRYKRALTTGARTLVWLRVQKPRIRFAAEDAARRFRNRLRAPRDGRVGVG
jgi:CelD/BcsL family acetyltransferase involved in cellulose biosynthesis